MTLTIGVYKWVKAMRRRKKVVRKGNQELAQRGFERKWLVANENWEMVSSRDEDALQTEVYFQLRGHRYWLTWSFEKE